MKFGGIVASTDESDFRFDVTLSRWRPWRHFVQKSAAAWSRLCSSVRQFLVYSTIVLVASASTKTRHFMFQKSKI